MKSSVYCCMLLCASLASHFQVTNCDDYVHTIYINPATGEDSSECFTSNSPSSPCANLTWVFQHSRQDSTNYVLSQGTHTLTEDTPQFKDLKHLAFTGNGTLVTCTDTGLAFLNVEDIVFHAIAFSGCASLRNSTSKNFAEDTVSEFMVGLYFYLCESITMLQVSVSHSPNATGVVIYNTNGTNTISDSNFTDNRVAEKSLGGGGLYVEFTYCVPGILSCDTPISERNQGASYTFTSCEFTTNYADNGDAPDITAFIVSHHSKHHAFGHGGGLSLFIRGTASRNNFTIQNCTFQKNIALWGGGFFANFHDSTHSNTITVSGCKFLDNYCPYSVLKATQGGGMRVGRYIYGFEPLPPEAIGNVITIQHCTFKGNTALHGGGLSASFALQKLAFPNQTVSLYLLDNTFDNNTAKLGSAVKFDRFSSILEGSAADVRVEDCLFCNNSDIYEETVYPTGIGVVYIDKLPVWFKGYIEFSKNNGSALSVIGAVVNFTECHSLFSNNQGSRGAAIALLGSAYLQVSNGTEFVFDYNTALSRGGAIYNAYLSWENVKSDSNCFIRHTDPYLHPDDWNATFLFRGNTDQGGTHVNSIHSTSILPCFVPGDYGLANSTAQIFCWNNWLYSSRCVDEIASDIGNITFTEGNTINVFPGWPFSLPIRLRDDLNHTIEHEMFEVSYKSKKEVDVYLQDDVVIFGEPNELVEIAAENFGNRIWHLGMNVYLKECPVGFVAVNTTNKTEGFQQCVCSGSYGGQIICDDISKTVRLLNGVWIGKVDDTNGKSVHVVMDCPQFCDTTHNGRFTNATHPDVDWDAIVCGPTNRRGINCGKCIEGYGPAVNSLVYKCVNCTDINQAAHISTYAASVYLPLTALFTTLIIFDIRLTNGPANAFILYCQIITSNFDLNTNGMLVSLTDTDHIHRFIHSFPLGIFNLEMIENYIPPLCLSPSFNILQILLLDYAVAFFPLFMIIFATLVLKISETCCIRNRHVGIQQKRCLLSVSRFVSAFFSGKNERKSVSDALLPAFASFLLLSYTKFTTTTFYLLLRQHPIDDSGNRVSPPRLFYAPNITTTDSAYNLYFIPAVLVLVTIIAFTPLVLLDYPLKALEWCIERVRCLKRIYPNDKIHLFLNMFQGCYRPKMRFFAGLYFLFRLVMNICYVLTSWLQQLLVQQFITMIMIFLIISCQPYEWKILNYVDALIFINLGLLNSIAFYLYSFHWVNPEQDPSVLIVVVQYFLVFIPLVYMVSYIVWKVTQPHHTKVKLAFRKLARCPADDQEKDLEESMFDRAKNQNSYTQRKLFEQTLTEVEKKPLLPVQSK